MVGCNWGVRVCLMRCCTWRGRNVMRKEMEKILRWLFYFLFRRTWCSLLPFFHYSFPPSAQRGVSLPFLHPPESLIFECIVIASTTNSNCHNHLSSVRVRSRPCPRPIHAQHQTLLAVHDHEISFSTARVDLSVCFKKIFFQLFYYFFIFIFLPSIFPLLCLPQRDIFPCCFCIFLSRFIFLFHLFVRFVVPLLIHRSVCMYDPLYHPARAWIWEMWENDAEFKQEGFTGSFRLLWLFVVHLLLLSPTTERCLAYSSTYLPS